MKQDQIELYKKLHSKLTYGMKRARSDEEGKKFEEGLKRLKEDKESMLAKFSEDNQLGWLGELTQVHESVETESTEVVTREMNFFHLKRELGLSHLKDDDEFVRTEVERYESVPHPNPVWAAGGEKLYFYTDQCSKFEHQSKNAMGVRAVAKAVPKAKSSAPKGELTVNWQTSTKKTAGQLTKLIKDIEKQISKTKRLKSSLNQLGEMAMKDTLQDAEEDMSARVQCMLVT